MKMIKNLISPWIIMGLFFSLEISAYLPSNISQDHALVKTDNSINQEEEAYVALRMHKAHETLQTFLAKNFDKGKTPKIGIVASGGGFRAAVSLLGMLKGLEEIKLLDSVSYLSALSGSTWSTSAWMMHDMCLDHLAATLRNKMEDPFELKKLPLKEIAHSLQQKIQYTSKVGLNDIYGALLGSVFLSTRQDPSGQCSFLHDLQSKASSGKYPFPIFTSILTKEDLNYQWLEFSPFEVGSQHLNSWIPSWALGRKFSNGKSISQHYPENLGYLLGTFGSLYATNVADALSFIENIMEDSFQLELPLECCSWIAKKLFGNKRISPPQFNNFTYELDGFPCSDHKRLTLVDAGFDFNLPFPPLLRRNVDLYIVCDASYDVLSPVSHTMQYVRYYMQENKHPFPDFNINELVKNDITLMYDKDNSETPVVIYVPNKITASSFDLNYSKEQFCSIFESMRNTIATSKNIFNDAVNITLEKK